MTRRTFLVALAAAVLAAAPAASAFADHHEKGADKPTRILFVTQSAGFKHGSVDRDKPGRELAPAEIAMKQLAQQSGLFTVDLTQDVAADLTKENLQNYDVVAFYTTGMLPIAEEDLDYFLNDWLKQPGHGFLGFHSATDTLSDNEAYRSFINGRFAGHPWGAGSTVTFKAHVPDFPGVKELVASDARPDGFTWTDEIYQYRNHDPAAVRVLASIDMANTDLKKPYHVPVIWVREWGQGKVFYNNLGHREDTWTKQPFLDSILASLRWIRGEAEGDATPNPEVSAAWDDASREAAPEEKAES
ncbi:ThuA domain-containing protein [Alienimonas sp. DA493]|uniref:ThuA domain-containing protein n=1 Tax=Alienimonas sp. DA493 TaxID=3373605 RepID=UPI0037546BEB